MLSDSTNLDLKKDQKSVIQMQADNEALWRLLREGHQQAIEDLYRFNYQVLYSFAFKICGDKEMSKDCVQDLFVRLWEKRNHLNEVSRVRSYLLQSIWHSVIREMKKKNKNISLDENGPYQIEVVFPSESKIIGMQQKEEDRHKLKQALENLSPRQKEIIFMQYYEGLTIDEIQQITELKYQSIKNLTHRAMLVLRDFFRSEKK